NKTKIISVVRARSLIGQGCVALLVTTVQAEQELPGLESVPVVCEFPDVFSDELLGCHLKERLTLQYIWK
ncbi:hypothetical protein PSY83_24020, partial [Shigella flexneri]|nr:hypothetical protein [Shigella flexneri]